MATLKQILDKHGFRFKERTTYSDRYALKVEGKWLPRYYVNLDKSSYERNAGAAVVCIDGKRTTINFEFNKATNSYKSPTEAQQTAFEALVRQCKELAVHFVAEPKKRAPRTAHNKGQALTAGEKFDNKIWRWLGDFYVCGFIDKDFRKCLYYNKSGKHIQVADTENVMVYAYVRQADLDDAGIPLTLERFEKWLNENGIKRKARKRVKRSYSLYD
jgi:hypothetical protein